MAILVDSGLRQGLKRYLQKYINALCLASQLNNGRAEKNTPCQKIFTKKQNHPRQNPGPSEISSDRIDFQI